MTHRERQQSVLSCRRRRQSAVLALCLVVILSSFFRPAQAVADHVVARIIAVNDGDTVTVVMNGKERRCRLIGIDAPESGQELWGARAREHLRKILKDQHWQIFVEVGLERMDKYNRLLVYLWTGDNRLVNEQMILDGYAVLFTFQPNSKYADRFSKAQKFAREKKLGIWGPNGLQERPVEYKKKHPRE